jgi:hypothetical protein
MSGCGCGNCTCNKVDWDNIDDKELMLAYRRAQGLQGKEAGFSFEDAIRITMNEFENVNRDDLIKCFSLDL